MDLGPCCPQSTSGVSYIYVKGTPIGIKDLPAIVAAVRDLGLEDAEEIKRELIARVKANNYIPKGMEEEYGNALMVVYKRMNSASGGI